MPLDESNPFDLQLDRKKNKTSWKLQRILDILNKWDHSPSRVNNGKSTKSLQPLEVKKKILYSKRFSPGPQKTL